MDTHSSIYILLSVIFFGLWGYLGKIGMDKMGRFQYLLFTYLFTALTIIILSIYNGENIKLSKNLYIPLLGGVTTAIAALSFFTAAERVSISILSALVALYPAITIILSVITFGEKLNNLQLVGVILALAAGILLGYSPPQ